MAESSSEPRSGRAPNRTTASVVPEGLDIVSREPTCAEAPLGLLDSAITPTDRFFVRNHFPVPSIDPSRFRLSVSGALERPAELSLDKLRQLPSRTLVATLECAGNSRRAVHPPVEGVPWNHGAVGTAEWEGVSLGELLDRMGVRSTAREVILEGADRGREVGATGEIPYAMSLPLDKARERDTLLATRMNGEPLTPTHGAPLRAIVPGWYGMASVKWLSRIIVSDAPFLGFYRTQSYVIAPEGPTSSSPAEPVTRLRVKSIITWPTEGTLLARGSYIVRGAAWSGEAPIERVEVTARPVRSEREVGGWVPAQILTLPSTHAWVRWECPIELRAEGHFVLRVRAFDRNGNTQPLHPEWNYRGMATHSVHAVRVTVRAS